MFPLLRRRTAAAPSAPAVAAERPSPAAEPATPASIRDVFVARQPIFDDHDRLYAYELLYRSGSQQNWANGMSAQQMAHQRGHRARLGRDPGDERPLRCAGQDGYLASAGEPPYLPVVARGMVL